MQIYLERDGERIGPYTQEQVTAGLAAGTFLPTDLAWRRGRMAWTPLESLLANPRYNPCPQCQGELVIQTESPQRGTGIIVVVLGILFSPICVGIPFIVWGIMLIAEYRSYWHCRGCGRTFPV